VFVTLMESFRIVNAVSTTEITSPVKSGNFNVRMRCVGYDSTERNCAVLWFL